MATTSVHVRLSPDLEKRIRGVADREQRTFSNAMSVLVKEALDARDKEMEDSR